MGETKLAQNISFLLEGGVNKNLDLMGETKLALNIGCLLVN